MNKTSICTKCSLYKNQKISLDDLNKGDVMWVGISAQKGSGLPLGSSTNSGKFVQLIESKLPDKTFYKTNLCKCLPLDSEGKIRYPDEEEFDVCFDNFEEELKSVKPKIVILLGKIVSDFVSSKFDINNKKYTPVKKDGVYFLYIDHPSYLMIYKRKKLGEYIRKVVRLIGCK